MLQSLYQNHSHALLKFLCFLLIEWLSILVRHTFKRPPPAKADNTNCALEACDATAYGDAVSDAEGCTCCLREDVCVCFPA